MKKILTIAVFAIFSASSAFSASLTPSVGISYNNSAFAGSGTETNFDEAGSIKTTTQEHGAFTDGFASIFVEMGLTDNISIGLDYVPGTIASPRNFSREGNATQDAFPDPGSSSVQVDFEDFVSVYIKANVPMLGGTYIKAGYSEVDVIVNESMASGNTYGDVSTDGFVAAIGYQYDMDMGLSIRAEVMAHQFEDVKTDNGIAASSGTSANGGRNVVSVGDMMGARGTISIVKSF